jgi:hypothetical protein
MSMSAQSDTGKIRTSPAESYFRAGQDRFVAWRHLRGQLRGEHRQHRPRLPGQKAAGLLAAAAASHGQLGALAEIFRAAVSLLPSP